MPAGTGMEELCTQFRELLAGEENGEAGGIRTDSSLAPLFQLIFHSFTSGTYPIYQKRRLTPPTLASLVGVDSLWVQRPLQIACGCSSYSREKMASGPAAAGSLQGSASHPRAKAAALRCRTQAQPAKSVSHNPAPSPSPGAHLLPESLNFPSMALWGAQGRIGFTTHPLST